VRPRGRMVVSSRTHLVLPQVTSKRTLQCVQVTDAPADIVQSSDCSSVRPSENVRVTTMEAVRAVGEPDAEAAVLDALGFVSRCLIRGSLILEVVETLFV
jgi:hypothetical protein